MQVFDHDDAGYVAWLKNNPTGYVLNCRDKPPGFMLHRANCIYVNNPGPKNWGKWTHEYIKVCATDEASIEQWIQEEPAYCQVCFRERVRRVRTRMVGDLIKKDDQMFLFDRDKVKIYRIEPSGDRTEITDLNDVAHILVWGRTISKKTRTNLARLV